MYPYSVLYAVQYLYSTICSPVHCTIPIFIQLYLDLFNLQFLYSSIFSPVQSTIPILDQIQFQYSSNPIQFCTLYSSYIQQYSDLYSIHCTVPIFIQPYSVLYTLQFQYSSTHIQFCTLYSSNIYPTIFSPVYFIVYSSYIHRSIFTSVHRIVSIFIKLS